MSKYAFFVLGAYGASAAAFAWMILDTLLRGHAARLNLERLEANEPGGQK